MCNHKFKNDENKSCKLDEFLSQVCLIETDIPDTMLDLPHDSAGECIFHSRDLEWKRKNNFTERLKYLILLWNKYGEYRDVTIEDRVSVPHHYIEKDEVTDGIELDDFVLIGNTPVKDLTEEEAFNSNSEENDFCFLIQDFQCRKRFVLRNAIIESPIIIRGQCRFKGDLIISNCIFKKGVFINQLNVDESLMIDNRYLKNKNIVSFRNNFIIDSGSINFSWTIEDSIFEGNTRFSELVIAGPSIIANNILRHKTDSTSFYCIFKEGLIFRQNKTTSIRFVDCDFRLDSTFENLELLGDFWINQPKIKGQIKFIGNKKKFLFNPKSSIDITTKNFKKNGMITFDYCNLLDLGDTFLKNCRKLAEIEKIKIEDTCKIDRFKIVRQYSYTELKSNLIEDFTHIINRYFYEWYGINLSVNIIRDREEQLIIVVFRTTENIENFDSLLEKLPEKICNAQGEKSLVKEDIQRAFFDIIQRIFSSNLLSINERIGILTLNDLIEKQILLNNEIKEQFLNNYQPIFIIMGDYIKQLGFKIDGNNNTVINPDTKQIGEGFKIDFAELLEYGVEQQQIDGLKNIEKKRDKKTVKNEVLKWFTSVSASVAARGLYDNIPKIYECIKNLIV